MNNGVQRGQGNLEKFYRALHLSGRRRVTTIFFFFLFWQGQWDLLGRGMENLNPQGSF